MCAIGRYETTRAPAGTWLIWANDRPAVNSLSWVICTPFGGPVVPDV